MKFNIAMAIDEKDKTADDLIREATELLSRYDLNKEVLAYKRYISEDERKDMARYYSIEMADSESLAKKVNDWNEGEGGVDEKGLYQLTTNNPEGRFDSWEIFYYATPDDFEGNGPE